MASNSASPSLRLWPGLLIVALQWTIMLVTTFTAPGTMVHGFSLMGGPGLGLLLLLFVWWVWKSQAPRREKIYGSILPLVSFFATFPLADPSAPTGIYIYGIPLFCAAFVVWAWLSRSLADNARLISFLAVLLVFCFGWTLVRMEGVDGDMAAQFSYRFAPTAEDRLLAMGDDLPPAAAAATPTSTNETINATEDIAAEDVAADDTTEEDIAEEDSAADETGAPDAQDTPRDETALADAGDGSADDLGGEDGNATEGDGMMAASPSTPSPWPGFRGPMRDGIVSGVALDSNWQASPPQEIWKRPVGPGWSSFAYANGLIYTQEQRGDDEIVSAYDATTGEPRWAHRDKARFWEALAGAGPRATPTYSDGKIYTLGATGLLNALDADTGAVIWARNAAEDTNAPTPEWGFSASPLLRGGLVILHTGGPDDKGVVAYDAATGEPRWFAPAGPLSYSSVHAAELGGAEQLLILTGDGAHSLDPSSGEVLWQHEWPMPNGARIVQPVFSDDGDLFIGTGFGMGVRRIAVGLDGQTWTTEEKWTSNFLKPYYNDFVLHEGYLYGFDGRILACVDAATGERIWKGGRYGNGQLMLLEDQDLLLVLSDRGDLALVSAQSSGFEEVGRVTAIQGKTWNHPALVDGVLYVRNGEEMAAFRLPQTRAAARLTP